MGRVTLVGAGPAGPELLTLAGKAALAIAECVVYDRLVDPAILQFAPADAERHFVGKRAGDGYHGAEQHHINELLVAKAKAGLRVVRLKGGDPLVFGRGGEELAALEDAEVPFKVIPGVTAALAAAAGAFIPLTHRDQASALAFFTAHSQSPDAASTDFAALAAFPGTLVGYMPLARRKAMAAGLIAGGRAIQTPVTFVEWAGSPRQRIVETTLGEVGSAEIDVVEVLSSPTVAVIGDVCRLQPRRKKGALDGIGVLTLRPPSEDDSLPSRLADLGAWVCSSPAFYIEAPLHWTAVDQELTRIEDVDWVAFTSRHAVEFLFNRMRVLRMDLRKLAGVRIAAVGPATSSALADRGIEADLVSQTHQAAALADEMAAGISGKAVLLPRADCGRTTLEDVLLKAGARVRSVVIYRQVECESPTEDAARLLKNGALDWAAATSGNTARALRRWLDLLSPTKIPKIASIGPTCTWDLRKWGLEATVEAKTSTAQGLVDAMASAISSSS